MFIYWLIIVVVIVKIAEFIDNVKDKKFVSLNVKKKRKNSIPKEITYL